MQQDRLQMDLKALEMAKLVLIKYAIELLKKEGVFQTLETPQNIEAISQECGLLNKKMLENMLDLLVGEKILSYKDGYYSITNIKEIGSNEAEQFLNQHYKESFEWIKFVNQYSEVSLTKNKPSPLTGFEEKKAIYYWTKIMEQSPYSLRVIAINELYKGLKANSLILDYGCGGGIGLEQLLELSNMPLQIVGSDPSKNFLGEAKKRIMKLSFKDLTKQQNKEKIKFEDINNLDKYVEKFDAIFVSIIFNHMTSEEHIKVFGRLKKLLKNGGKLVIVQLLDFGKFNRNPIWVMYNVPTHKGYPMKDQFIKSLKNTFSKVEEQMNGIITISIK